MYNPSRQLTWRGPQHGKCASVACRRTCWCQRPSLKRSYGGSGLPGLDKYRVLKRPILCNNSQELAIAAAAFGAIWIIAKLLSALRS